MSVSSHSSDEARLAMERLATKLLGGRPPNVAAQQTARSASPETPRSTPAVLASATSPSWSAPPKPTENAFPSSTSSFSASFPQSSSISLGSSGVTMQGPSLRGTAEQLAAARSLLSASTKAGNKTRPGRMQHQSSAQESIRFATASTVATERPANVFGNAQSITAEQRPAVGTKNAPLSTETEPGTIDVSALHGRPTVETVSELPERGQVKDELSHGHPSPIPARRPDIDTPLHRQRASINSSIKSYKLSRPSTTEPPPELCERVAAAGMSELVVAPNSRKAALVSSTPSKREERAVKTTEQLASLPTLENAVIARFSTTDSASSVAGKEKPASQLLLEESVEDYCLPRGKVPPHLRRRPATVEVSTVPEAVGSHSATTALAGLEVVQDVAQPRTMQEVEAPTKAQAPKPEATETVTAGTGFRTNAKDSVKPVDLTYIMDKAKRTIASDASLAIKLSHTDTEFLNKRIDYLEKQNAEMARELEQLTQAEERRRFLGTDSARVPFGVGVKCPDGSICQVQAHAELKVHEMVRRIAAKSNIVLTVMSQPRIVVDGTSVGHLMTLGEVGIVRDSSLEVELKYGT